MPTLLWAKQKTPLPLNAYDGGAVSAESFGRGRTIASNQGSMASGSENPAALIGSGSSSFYTTAFIGETSDISDTALRSSDTVHNKVLQYMAMGAEKGAIFYEPLGRQEERGGLLEHEFSADAVGFAASDKFKGGSIGVSIAYLHSSLASTIHTPGQPDITNLDTGNGMRMNFGFRYPTGPFMWGLLLQNAPGFIWWKDYKRDMLPFRMRVGNTWRISPGILFSAESETRYYREGGKKEDFIYLGSETALGKPIVLRAGVYSNEIGKPDQRHYTGGLTWNLQNDVSISYALESFEVDKQKVKKSVLSVRWPLTFEQEQ